MLEHKLKVFKSNAILRWAALKYNLIYDMKKQLLIVCVIIVFLYYSISFFDISGYI